MNLALLNPFRQADRIDSTLTIPRSLHPPRPKVIKAPDSPDKKKSSASAESSTTVKIPDEQKSSIDDAKPEEPASKSADNVETADKVDSSLAAVPSSLVAEEAKSNMEIDDVNTDNTKKDEGENKDKEAAVVDVEMKDVTDGGKEEKSAAGGGEDKKAATEGGEKEKAANEGGEDEKAEGNKDTPVKEGDEVITVKKAKTIADSPKPGIKPKVERKKRGPKSSAKGKGQKSPAKDASKTDKEDDDDEDDWTACYIVSFNRRGQFLASGHASGLISVHDFLGRTLSALYWPPPGIKLEKGKNNFSASLERFVFSDDRKGKGGGKKEGGKKRGAKGKKKKGAKGKEEQDAPKEKADEDSATPTATNDAPAGNEEESNNQLEYINGATSLSWGRRSRTLLAGAVGDKNLRLMDNTHPLVSTDCTDAAKKQFIEGGGKDVTSENVTRLDVEEKKHSIISKSPLLVAMVPPPSPGEGERIAIRLETVSLGCARLLRSNIVTTSSPSSVEPLVKPVLPNATQSQADISEKYKHTMRVPTRRHPALILELPAPLGGPCSLHPHDSHAGFACMNDGSLALFWMPPMAFYETMYAPITGAIAGDIESKQWVVNLLKDEELSRVGNLQYLVQPPGGKESSSSDPNTEYFITCAAFGRNGDVIWAATKCGTLLAFRIDSLMMDTLRGCINGTSSDAAVAFANQMVHPVLCVKVQGGATAWHIVVSRKSLLLNSSDCSLRLYDVDELSEAFDTVDPDIKPRFVFQDNISKAPFASCDFSGDGEYVVGGANSVPQPGENYQLFLWNCITGQLVDQLTGPVSTLYSLSCHPTRPFIAVGTSDGLVDVWGARLDWVAFAPDFQALQQNELYEEREDEFDIVVDSGGGEGSGGKAGSLNSRLPEAEDDDVDITTVDKVPAFDSDSEEETGVFYFHTKVDPMISEKAHPGPKRTAEE